jgi:hypothetical protein
MIRALLKAGLIATCLTLVPLGAQAQHTIHAVSGTVRAINPDIQMIEITTDDGSSGHFRWLRKSDGTVELNKTISADAVPAEKYTSKGTHVIVYYFGDGDVRTAIAVRELGDESLEKSSGTVVKLDRNDHLLTIKNASGAEETFHLDRKTVSDTATGVTEGLKSDLSKGDQVRVTAAQANGGATALLIVSAV